MCDTPAEARTNQEAKYAKLFAGGKYGVERFLQEIFNRQNSSLRNCLKTGLKSTKPLHFPSLAVIPPDEFVRFAFVREFQLLGIPF